MRSEDSTVTHDSQHMTEGETITVDEVDESNIEVVSSGRRLVDRHVYTLRPQVVVNHPPNLLFMIGSETCKF